MADPRTLKAWLVQARADHQAATVAEEGVLDCHRRYWFQQACEKGIKALGLVLWRGPASDEGQFRALVLNRHDPLKRLQKEPALPRSLWLLLREIETELGHIDNSGLLLRVDATTASTNPTDASYRYPFVDRGGDLVAPATWSASDWDAYQGNEMGVAKAIDRLLSRVEDRIKMERGPT